MGILGVLWFPVDRYVLEPRQLQYVKVQARLLREAKEEVQRLKSEVHVLRQFCTESRRLVCLRPAWVEQRLGDLDRGIRPACGSIDTETKQIDLIREQMQPVR